MTTLATGNDDEVIPSLSGFIVQSNICEEKMYDHIESFSNKQSPIIWNEIVNIISKYIKVDNLIRQKEAIEKNMLDDVNKYYAQFITISDELNPLNCLKTDIKDITAQKINDKTQYFLLRKPDKSKLKEEDGCYVKYPVIAWYLYLKFYKKARDNKKSDFEYFTRIPEPNDMMFSVIVEPQELITYIQNEKWKHEFADDHITDQNRRSGSVANLKDVEFVDDPTYKDLKKPPTPNVGPAPNLFRKGDFDGLTQLEIPQARGWVKNILKKSEKSTPTRYVSSNLFTCDICRKDGVVILPMSRQALTDHIKAKHAYRSSGKSNARRELMTSPEHSSASSLSIKRRQTSKPLEMNSGLNSKTPLRKPRVQKKAKIKKRRSSSHEPVKNSPGSEPQGKSLTLSNMKRSISLDPTNQNSFFLPPQGQTQEQEPFENDGSEDGFSLFPGEKDKKSGGRSKSGKRRKKSTKKKSRRRKKRN